MSLREALEVELEACRQDPARDLMHLNLLADEFAMKPGFDPLEDGALENEVIVFTTERKYMNNGKQS